jgi:hypothetical protein
VTPTDQTVRDTFRLVRERHYTSCELLQMAVDQLGLAVEHATGTLMIDLLQGHVRRIRLREEQDIHYDGPADV